ncbi:MAG: rhodanese-like domain-containing protein [Deltaproteobacteria bacterium]|nr:rhodanese-like domain-containing protein [Deltaproteobacteria bacterium]
MSKPRLSPAMRRILLEALILCALSLTVGLSLNFQLVMKAFTGKTVVPVKGNPVTAGNRAATVVEQEFPIPVELDELDELLAAGALLVDARNLDAYRSGHLAGAVSLPLGKVAARLADFMRKVPKTRLLIVYCSGFGCPDSFDLGVRLLAAGYRQVRVFEGGFPQWRDAGRPLEEGLK